ncbi:hypothetical protein JAAARDRAFT_124307 [Jaapia argillacea MUCL 33604]|uniref:Uncharacterized protein n=1 Tax=Jaapia argillacea MUCL 33604 TaxID=933084 RepID=A0A067QDV9_9AGAM|nr:hypothetical protein JAAARDRAFT_124307 [Jaapia argillacea MUCL 33604]
MTVARLQQAARHWSRRLYSTETSVEALDKWIASKKELVLSDTLSWEHLSDLYITLPTRDGTRTPYEPPKLGQPLSWGHHLAFFHPRNPENRLRPDGTDSDFCPPEPFTRRMWAGGKMVWKSPLLIGEKAYATSKMGPVDKKGFEKGTPMVFVKQKIEYTMAGQKEVAVEEERSHVYLPSLAGVSKRPSREGAPDYILLIPAQMKRLATSSERTATPDFALSYTPSLTTLFRFSALTFNGHYIHLDKDYAQKVEGYPERLVHGPLTALMLLETVVFHKPNVQFQSFEYRAVNPVIVGRPVVISGSWHDEKGALVWATDEEGTVGMTGIVTFG